VIAFACEYSSTRNGFPFGLYHYFDETRTRELWISNVPFWDSLSFVFLSYFSLVLAGGLLALYAPALYYDGLVQKASLGSFLLILSLWLLVGVGSRRRFVAAGASLAAAAGQLRRRLTHIQHPLPAAARGLGNGRVGAEAAMQTAGHIETRLQRGDHQVDPSVGQAPTQWGEADDQSLGPGLHGFFDPHIGQASICRRAFQAKLRQTALRAPMGDAGRRFGAQEVIRVAKKQQVRCFQAHQVGHIALLAVSRSYDGPRFRDGYWINRFVGKHNL
jgi:hypothetical protein